MGPLHDHTWDAMPSAPDIATDLNCDDLRVVDSEDFHGVLFLQLVLVHSHDGLWSDGGGGGDKTVQLASKALVLSTHTCN